MTERQSALGTRIDQWANNPAESTELTINSDVIQVDKRLRHLPKKRLTCLAQWKDKTVVAKFFYGERFEHQANHESSVLTALALTDINAPKLLHTIEQSDCAVLIIEYIPPSCSLLQWLKTEPDAKEFDAVMSKTTALVLACHQAGFNIKDPHFDNFLLSNDAVFIIDAGDIESTKATLSNEQSVNNIALLYGQLPVTWDELAYPVASNLLPSVTEEDWQQRLIKKRRWRQRKFIDKKVFRNCTAYISEKSYSRFLVAKRTMYTEEIAQALLNPDALIDNGYLLKDGNTATVARVEIAGKTYVLKRYNIKKKIHSILRGLMWSRAAVSWRNGLLLEMLGIPTAKSYALIEERWGCMRRRSYLLTEFTQGPESFDIYAGDEYSEEEKKQWTVNIKSLFMLLKRSQVSHGDLKARNILCSPEGAAFIDLDGMKVSDSPKDFSALFNKDIKRFLRSWPLQWKENPYFK